jgi:Cdc6-like AAA superfamily ATPase
VDLEERVRSRLNPHTIFFPVYSHQDLLDILTHRAELALAEGSWTPEVLKCIAGMAKGDARAAIRILRRAAVLAEYRHLERITIEALKEQMKAVRERQRFHIMASLTKDHRMLLDIVKDKGWVLSGELRGEYLRRCSKLGRKPLSSRAFSDYANRLVQARLLVSERARVKGRVRLFRLAV